MATTRLIKSIVFRVPYLSVRSSRSSASCYAGVAILDEYQISLGGGRGLSPPQRPLCVVRRLGRKKKRARGAPWEGEKEKRGSRLFPLPIFPCALSNFSDYCYFYRDTQREPLRRRGGGGGGLHRYKPRRRPLGTYVTKMAACTGKHSIFRLLTK